MGTSKQVKELLTYAGITQMDLAGRFGMTRQSMSNKMRRNSWSSADLIKVAQAAGCKVGFILPNGETILLEDGEEITE